MNPKNPFELIPNNQAPTTTAPTSGPAQFNPLFPGGTMPVADSGLDDTFEIDLSQASSGNNRDYIAEGDYLGYVTNVTQQLSKAGNRMLAFEFMIAQGEYQGKTAKLYAVIAEPDGAGGWTPATRSLWKLTETLDALGLNDPDRQKPSIREITEKARRRCAIMTFVADGEYNGRPNISFKRVRPASEWGYPIGVTVEALRSPQNGR